MRGPISPPSPVVIVDIDSAAEKQIEGIPASDSNGLYGGSDNSDNSGVIRYIQIRHGETLLGDDNEIDLNTKHPEFLEWKWINHENITDKVVEFKLHVYEKIKNELNKLI